MESGMVCMVPSVALIFKEMKGTLFIYELVLLNFANFTSIYGRQETPK
jgi:hypothetical protein